MQDVLLVQKLERKKDLPHDLNSLVLSEAFYPLKSLMQVLGAVLERLLHNVKTLSVLENVIHSCNIWFVGVNKHFEVVNEQVARYATLAEHFFLEELER